MFSASEREKRNTSCSIVETCERSDSRLQSRTSTPSTNTRTVSVTINDGEPSERSLSVACMHCSDAPCMAVCPVDCFYQNEEGIVLHSKDLCIGCGYCFYACPFGAPQYPQAGNFGSRGKMDKCTFCAGGPEENNSAAEFQKYGRNRIAEGKLPICAEMCATKALLAGDGDVRIPHCFECGTRELLLLAFDLLEAQDVGRLCLHEALNQIEPQSYGVDVPSGQPKPHHVACYSVPGPRATATTHGSRVSWGWSANARCDGAKKRRPTAAQGRTP